MVFFHLLDCNRKRSSGRLLKERSVVSTFQGVAQMLVCLHQSENYLMLLEFGFTVSGRGRQWFLLNLVPRNDRGYHMVEKIVIENISLSIMYFCHGYSRGWVF